MSDLEARIAEVLGAHVAKRPWSDSGVTKCSCGERFVAEYDYQRRELHQVHQAAMLAPVIREREAEAWDEGWDAGWINAWDNAKSTSSKVATSPNPYRADSLVKP